MCWTRGIVWDLTTQIEDFADNIAPFGIQRKIFNAEHCVAAKTVDIKMNANKSIIMRINYIKTCEIEKCLGSYISKDETDEKIAPTNSTA